MYTKFDGVIYIKYIKIKRNFFYLYMWKKKIWEYCPSFSTKLQHCWRIPS